MAFEYQLLVFMTFFFLLAWLPTSAAKKQSFGLRWLASNREKTPNAELPAWGGRAERAHTNLKDNFPGFVVAILLLGHLGKFDESTAIAASVYVFARVLHLGSYIAGNFPIRFVSFVSGLSANFFLLLKALQ